MDAFLDTPLGEQQKPRPVIKPARIVQDSITREMSFEALQPVIGERRASVLIAIYQLGKATSIEISRHLNWPMHCVSGRITELRDHLSLIEQCGIQEDHITRRKYTLYRVKQ